MQIKAIKPGSAIATIRERKLGGATNVAMSARPAETANTPVFTRVALQNEVTHLRQLTELGRMAQDAHRIASSNLFAGGVLTEEIAAVAGQTIEISHGLGRAPLGWFGVSTQDNPFVATLLDLPTGLDRTLVIWLRPTFTCTTRLYIF